MGGEQYLMITKNDCPWCDRAKELLKQKELNCTFLNIDDPQYGYLWKQKMKDEGLRTVPQIYEHNKDTQDYIRIGGYTETKDYLDG